MSNICGCIRVDEGPCTDLDDLMRYVAPVVPVPHEIGLEYIRQAYITFARKTGLLVSHQKIALQRDVHEYVLQAPEGYEVFGLMQHEPRFWGYVELPNAHRWFAYYGDRVRMLGTERLYLETAPSVDGRTLEIALHLLPNSCAVSIPNEIATPYGRDIAKGAISELLEIPNKPWSNPRAAAKYERDFHIACQSGRNLFLTNRGSRRVMMDHIRVL